MRAVLGSIGYVARQGFVGPNWPTGQVFKFTRSTIEAFKQGGAEDIDERNTVPERNLQVQ